MQGTTGVGYTLSGMDTTGRTAAVRHGVTISEMNFVDPFYPYYDSKLLLKRSPHVPLDRIQNEIAEYKKLGIRILGVYPPTLQGEVYEKHPDWRRITSDTRTIPQVDMKAAPYGGMLCLLGPYGDFFIDVLAEILEKHPKSMLSASMVCITAASATANTVVKTTSQIPVSHCPRSPI